MKNAHHTVIILFSATILCFAAYLLVGTGMDIGVSLLLEVISFLLFAAGICAAAYAVKKLIAHIKPRIPGKRRSHPKE